MRGHKHGGQFVMTIANYNEAIVVQNDHIYLRKLNAKDARFILKLTNEEGWLTHIGDRNVHTIKQAEQFIRTGPMHTYKAYGFGLYLVVQKSSNKALGLCGLLKRSYLEAPDLGYAISEDYYRRGFAYMSCQLVLGILDQLTEARCIYASTAKNNIASQKLLKKLGFAKDGVLVSDLTNDNLQLYQKCRST